MLLTLQDLQVGVRRRAHQDSALAAGLLTVSLEENVAGKAPSGSPGVLDFVVVNTVEGSVADSKDAVVKVGAASSGQDTRLVQLEGGLIGFDGNRHGLLGKGRHQSSVRVLGHISV